tara:strand:- start:830 stop:1237 length:408 start_codon:yes stop_codon:yes gene_type:complete
MIDPLHVCLFIVIIFSVAVNVFLLWYIRGLFQRLYYVSDNIFNLVQEVQAFEEHLDSVHNLEMFYGDEVLGNLISHSKGLLGILEDFREIYSLFDEDSETQETGEEDITEEVPIDAVTQTEKKTQKGKTLFYEGA